MMSPVEHGILHEVWDLKCLGVGCLQVVTGVSLVQSQCHPLEPKIIVKNIFHFFIVIISSHLVALSRGSRLA